MSEDTPLYGEQSQATKIILIVIQGVVASFVLFTVIAGIVWGIKRQAQNILLAITIVELTVFRWYTKDSLDGKYKWLLVALVLILVWTCIVLNTYAWVKPPVNPATLCDGGNGYYAMNPKECFKFPSGLRSCVGLGMCMCITAPRGQNTDFTAVCTNCTQTPCFAPRPMP